jgi:general stress protein YciG
MARGFASLTPKERREAAARGGRALRPEQRSFSQDRELASAAGRIGGTMVPPERRSFSQNRELARAAGAKGGKVSRRKAKESADGLG